MRILAGRVLPCAEIHVLRRPFECSGVKLKRLRVRGVVPGVAVGGERGEKGPARGIDGEITLVQELRGIGAHDRIPEDGPVARHHGELLFGFPIDARPRLRYY